MRDALTNFATGNHRSTGAGGSVVNFFRNVRDGFRFASELRSATSDLVSPQPWLMNAFGLGVSKSGATISENAALNVSCVRRCVDLRAMLIAKLPVKVFRKTANGPEEQREHPLAKMLRGRVSPARTSYKWRYVSQVCFDLGGNAYSRVLRDQFEDLSGIVWTKAGDIRALHNETTDAVAFDYKGSRLAQHQVLHVANMSTNGVTGRSPLSDLRESVGLALTAEEAAARTFSNGNRQPGVIVATQNKSLAQMNEFMGFWMQNFSGSQNQGKTPLIGGGFDWKAAGMSNHDAELLLTRRFSVEEICRVYHIPLLLGGDANSASAWGSAVEKIMRGLVEFTLDSLCVNWESEMNTTLLSEREQEEGYYIKFMLDALLRGSFADRAKIYQIMRGIAAMDVNQIRDLEEWPLYPDAWAGDPRLPMNNQGGGGTAATDAPSVPADAPAAGDTTK